MKTLASIATVVATGSLSVLFAVAAFCDADLWRLDSHHRWYR